MVGWATALALGKSWNRFHPQAACRVLVYNVEDDEDEQQRRFSAVLRQFDHSPKDIAHKIMRVMPEGNGALIRYDDDVRTWRFTDLMGDLEQHVMTFRPDVIMLDPFSELHDADENDNTAVRAVVALLRFFAQRHNLAVSLLSHTRKGSADSAGDMDIVRGASSSVAAARLVLTVLPMTKDEAKEFSISEDLRRRFVRMDSAKSNYAPASSAEWFELTEYELDNTEAVAAAVPWKPQGDITLDAGEQTTLEDVIAAGVNGHAFSPQLSDKQWRSVSNVFSRFGIRSKKGQADKLNKLLANGFDVAEFRQASNRQIRHGLRRNDGCPNVDWL